MWAYAVFCHTSTSSTIQCYPPHMSHVLPMLTIWHCLSKLSHICMFCSVTCWSNVLLVCLVVQFQKNDIAHEIWCITRTYCCKAMGSWMPESDRGFWLGQADVWIPEEVRVLCIVSSVRCMISHFTLALCVSVDQSCSGSVTKPLGHLFILNLHIGQWVIFSFCLVWDISADLVCLKLSEWC